MADFVVRCIGDQEDSEVTLSTCSLRGALLARLGVAIGHEGRGLGAGIGCPGLLVHAETPQARDFYLLIPEFEPSPTDDLHLVLLIEGHPQNPPRLTPEHQNGEYSSASRGALGARANEQRRKRPGDDQR